MHLPEHHKFSPMIQADILSFAGLRTDGRKADELRRIRHKLSVFLADGSSYLESGLNKVLVVVTGPMEPCKSNDQVVDKVNRTIRHLILIF